MKTIFFLGLCSVAFAFYTDIDDNLNMDAVVASPEEIRKIMECFLDKGPCTPAMNSYKKHIMDILTSKCKDCSPIQKHKIAELVKEVEHHYPNYLKISKAKYDAEGKYTEAFENEMQKY